MPPTPPPTVLAMLTCGSVYQDDVSGKASLLGVSNGYRSDKFPVQMPPLFVYLAMSDGRGPTSFFVRLVDGAENPLFTTDTMTTRFDSPLDVKEFAVQTTGLVLPAPDTYRWQVLYNGAVIHERTFVVTQVG